MEFINSALNSINFNIENIDSNYYNIDGIKVPRVTEILSTMIHSDTLMYWANSLGFKGQRYKDVLNRAANIGTEAHDAIEKFLINKTRSMDNTPFKSFLSWYNIVTQELNMPIEVLMVECSLTCEWFGGTLDALLKIGGRTYLVDFKTSNHVTYKYFLQLAAYRYMLKRTKNIDVDGVLVLQLGKEGPMFNEYLLDFNNPNHFAFINQCELTFLSLVFAYYNIKKSEVEYISLFEQRRKGENKNGNTTLL